MPPNREGGIRKRNKERTRRDRDGDLVMKAAPGADTARPRPGAGNSTASLRPRKTTGDRGTGSALIELRVTGWTDETEIDKIIKFLERHASRSKKGGSSTTSLIKKSKAVGDVLTISVRGSDANSFKRIDGFTFVSQRGNQPLHISGFNSSSRTNSRRSPVAPAAPMNPQTSETVVLLQGFLERRYDPALKLLNLSKIVDDEQINAVGMFATISTQKKFVPVLMTLVEKQLKTKEQREEAIHSVTLSNNGLKNLDMVRDIGVTLPHIQNLDLSGNEISNTKDLLLFKTKLRRLEHLILSPNPIDTAQPGYEQELIQWFPRLRILNGQIVRSDAQIALLDAPKVTPMPASQNLWLDGDGIAQTFLVNFIQGFDNDRAALVQQYYDDQSTFSMAVNTQAKGGPDKKPSWDSYIPQSRNIKIINSPKTRERRKFRGPQRILQAFNNLPPTRHPALDTVNYSIDCQPQPGLPDPTGQFPGVIGLLVILRGEYEEHRTARGADEIVRRAFDRTFTLGPGGPTGVRVINDMCSLRAAGAEPSWIPHPAPAAALSSIPAQAPAQIMTPAQASVQVEKAVQPAAPGVPTGLTAEQEAMVMHVHQATKLTIPMATDCLAAANWNLEAAAQIFTAQKDSLPPEAFCN